MRNVNMNSVRAIDRAIDLLDVFSIENPTLTIDEITAATKLPKTTAYRILYTLELRGLIKYDSKTLKYKLGLKILEYSGAMTSVLDVRQEAEDILIDLQEQAKQTVIMAVPEHDAIIYIFKRENPEGFKYSSFIGHRRPLHFGVLGQVIMAFLSEDELERYMKNHKFTKLTAKTVTEIDLLKKRYEQIREEKVYVDMEETFELGFGISAPVFNSEGTVIAALGVIGHTTQLDHAQMDALKSLVKKAGIQISKKMGFTRV